MIRLLHTDGCFSAPDTNEPVSSLHAVVVDPGKLCRAYYEEGNQVKCWSQGCTVPHESVPDMLREANRCLDCTKSIKNSYRARGSPCKFFTFIKLVLPYRDEVYTLRIGGLSLFSKDRNKTNFYKYIEYLKSNSEQLGNVLTEIYFEEQDGYNKMYFKPVRPLAEEELQHVATVVEATDNINAPTEVIFMTDQSHKVKNVEFLFPRLNQPYKFDRNAGKKGRSVPCAAEDDGAKYEISFAMTNAQAKELHGLMQEAFLASPKRDESWGDKLPNPFEKNEDGLWVGKANKKAAYNNEATKPPTQYDAKNKLLDSDFMLTTGSKGNLLVKFIPYKMSAKNLGVSLQLIAVQVLDYKPYKSRSPFDEEEGFTADESAASPFEEEATSDTATDMFDDEPAPAKAPVEDDLFGDDDDDEEIKEPVKRKKKKEDKADTPEKIADIIDMWGDD
jgi:hypothetical protein